jgi:hypothetical protein
MTFDRSSPGDHSPLLAVLGTHVKIELIDDQGIKEQLDFDIVPDRIADFAHGYLGEGTPLGRAILGRQEGSVVFYQSEGMQKVLILSISPAQSDLPEEVAARRKETYQKAIHESDRTNAMIFASSFSGKWGDYDPEGIEKWEEVQKKKEGEG